MGNIICCVCGRKVGTTDLSDDLAAGLCDVHRAEARKRNAAEDEELARLEADCRQMKVARKATQGGWCGFEALALVAIIAALVAVL